jgi:hypothetical protein
VKLPIRFHVEEKTISPAAPDDAADLRETLIPLRRLSRAVARELSGVPESAPDRAVREALARGVAAFRRQEATEEETPPTPVELLAWEGISRRLAALEPDDEDVTDAG